MTVIEKEPLIQPEPIRNAAGDQLAVRFDVSEALTAELGENWQVAAKELIDTHGVLSIRDASDPTCRESDPNQEFAMITVSGDQLLEAFPGFIGLYKGLFALMMQQSLDPTMQPFAIYEDPAKAFEVYAQIPPLPNRRDLEFRLDAHIDGRYTAILPIFVPASTTVGRLVIANNPNAMNVDEIYEDATLVSHMAGGLLCAPRLTELPHYTEELLEGYTRAIVGINYPMASESESQALRLQQHFNGRQLS